jgi:hypothetical protein
MKKGLKKGGGGASGVGWLQTGYKSAKTFYTQVIEIILSVLDLLMQQDLETSTR